MAKKKAQVEPMIETAKGEGPMWYKDYDIKWLKKEKAYHPDGKLVDEYEKKFGEIK